MQNMQSYIWMEVGKKGMLRSTTPVHLCLDDSKLIFWNGSDYPCGKWNYIYGFPTPTEFGLLIMEFAASPKKHVPRKRHALQQIDDTDFELLDASSPVYDSMCMQGVWSNNSVCHTNKLKIIAKKIHTDKYIKS